MCIFPERRDSRTETDARIYNIRNNFAVVKEKTLKMCRKCNIYLYEEKNTKMEEIT